MTDKANRCSACGHGEKPGGFLNFRRTLSKYTKTAKDFFKSSVIMSTAVLFAVVGCGGGSSENSASPTASSERTFAAQTSVHGTTYSALLTDGLRIPGGNGLVTSGFFGLACLHADGGCEMGATETDYSGGTVVQTAASNGTVTLTLSNQGGSSSSTMKLDGQWGMLQDPRGCTYSRPLQLPADIPLSVGYAYSTSGVSVTRTCPDGSSSTDTLYGRKFSEVTSTNETTRWVYDAFDASNVRSYQIAFSVTWNTAQNKLASIMLVSLYDYKRSKGTLFESAP